MKLRGRENGLIYYSSDLHLEAGRIGIEHLFVTNFD